MFRGPKLRASSVTRYVASLRVKIASLPYFLFHNPHTDCDRQENLHYSLKVLFSLHPNQDRTLVTYDKYAILEKGGGGP